MDRLLWVIVILTFGLKTQDLSSAQCLIIINYYYYKHSCSYKEIVQGAPNLQNKCIFCDTQKTQAEIMPITLQYCKGYIRKSCPYNQILQLIFLTPCPLYSAESVSPTTFLLGHNYIVLGNMSLRHVLEKNRNAFTNVIICGFWLECLSLYFIFGILVPWCRYVRYKQGNSRKPNEMSYDSIVW